MGRGNHASTFNISTLRDRLQRSDSIDEGTLILAKFCSIIGDDTDSKDMFSGFQYFSHPKSAKLNC